MAVIVTSSNTTNTIVAGVNNSIFVLLPDVFVTTTGNGLFGSGFTGMSILIHGGLIAENDGIKLGNGGMGGFNAVHVTATGTIFAEANGFDGEGGNLHLLNEGSIFSRSDAVFMVNDNNEFINYGTVTSLVDGVDIDGDFTRITNYGSIQGADEGIEVTGNGIVITNYGSIVSTDSSSSNEGIEVNSSAGDINTFINFGTLSAIGAFSGGTGQDVVINRGTIFGQVELQGGDDRFDGRGGSIVNQSQTVTGDVEGGLGDDTFLIDDGGIELVEFAGQGNDTVRSWVSYTLPDHIETLILQGDEEIDGTGNDQANTINGNNAANELSGGDGDDTLNGGWGDDTLNGDDGNDTLRGHAGADRMVGGPGDDTYFINVIDDELIEYANEGTDHVHAPVSFALRDQSQHLENLTLSGSANIDGTGNGQVNTITGNSGDNVLNGAAAGDILIGGPGNDTFMDDSGADQMNGGPGDDTYFVDNPADQLIEQAGEGVDSVFSPITFALRDKSQHLENLTLTGSDDIDGTGNGQVNTITGNDGDNVLNGAVAGDILIGGAGNDTFMDDSGADQMIGGLGDDIYFVDNAADALTEFAGEGTDSVFSSITFALRDKSQHL